MCMDESSAPKSAETTGQGQVAAHSKEVIMELKEGGIVEALQRFLIDWAECM